MRGTFIRRLTAAAVFAAFAACSAAFSGDVVSTMRVVNAVGEAQGYRINPAYDAAAPMTAADLAPVQAFEVLRPRGTNRPITIGRLYTSCVCVQLEAPKRTFGPDERVILQLRNIKPTPTNGQVYAIYVQITSPIRTTLRFDTFVQTSGVVPESAAVVSAGSGTAAEPSSGIAAPALREDDDAEFGSADLGIADAAEAAVEAVREDAAAEKDSGEGETEAENTAPAAEPASAEDSAGNDAPAAPEEAEPENSAGEQELSAPAGEPEDSLTAAPRQPESSLIAQPAVPSADAGWDTPEPEAVPAAAVTPEPAAAGAAAETETARAGKPLQMISLITIGVRDMPRAVSFYEALGWRQAPRSKYDQTAFFQLNGQVLTLYPLADQLKEQNMTSASPAPGGITLAIHVNSKEEVEDVYRSFIEAGGTSLKEPTEMRSGAVTSYVADPDGNPWEISCVPQFRVDEDGGLWLP